MAAFPRTYEVVRSGQVQAATVHDADELIALRAELELRLRFGRGATERVRGALGARIGRLRAEGTGDVASAVAQLEDMQSILVDGMAPENLTAARRMDADFPTLCGALDMDEIKNESDQFHQDVAAEISASGVPDADALAEAFAEASAPEGACEPSPQERLDVISEPLEGVSVEPVPMTAPSVASPAETAAQVVEAELVAAEDLLAQIEAGQDLLAAAAGVAVPPAERTASQAEGGVEAVSATFAETVAGAFSEAQDELAAMSKTLSETADELGSLTETVAATVSVGEEASDAEDDLAAAMAEMTAPSGQTPEPTTESVIDSAADGAVDIAEVGPDVTGDADLGAALAASPGTGTESPAEGGVDATPTGERAPGAVEPGVLEDTGDGARGQTPLAEVLHQAAEPMPAAEDPLADLLRSIGTNADDRAQVEAFAALLKEPGGEPDASLAVAAARAAADAPGFTETVSAPPPVDSSGGYAVTEASAPSEPAAAPAFAGEAPSVPASGCDPVVPLAAAQQGQSLDAGDFRAQLDDLKKTLVSQIDRLGSLFEDVVRVQAESREAIAKALELKQVTDQAFDASRQFADAFAQAELARSACKQADAKVAAARLRWETAQQNVAAAAQGVSLPSKAPRRSSRKRGGGG